MEPPRKKIKLDKKKEDESKPPLAHLHACAVMSAGLEFPSLCFLAALELVPTKNTTWTLPMEELAYVLWARNHEKLVLSNGSEFTVAHELLLGQSVTEVAWKSKVTMSTEEQKENHRNYRCYQDGLECFSKTSVTRQCVGGPIHRKSMSAYSDIEDGDCVIPPPKEVACPTIKYLLNMKHERGVWYAPNRNQITPRHYLYVPPLAEEVLEFMWFYRAYIDDACHGIPLLSIQQSLDRSSPGVDIDRRVKIDDAVHWLADYGFLATAWTSANMKFQYSSVVDIDKRRENERIYCYPSQKI